MPKLAKDIKSFKRVQFELVVAPVAPYKLSPLCNASATCSVSVSFMFLKTSLPLLSVPVNLIIVNEDE